MPRHKFEKGNTYGKDNKPLRRDMTLELIDELNELCTRPGSEERREKMRWVIKALVNNAMDGDNAAIIAIFDRLEGKPAQKIVGPNNGPVKIQFNTIEEVKAYLLERGIDVERLPNPMKYLEPRRRSES
jgi:hypothetical protein